MAKLGIIFLVKNLRNKKNDFTRILITGAGSGLGKCASIALAELGYHVFASVEFPQEIEDLQKIIISKKLKIEVFCLNILDENDRKMISDFDIDILICNAAVR
ncbi:MAG: SDR family NAD(P)-dependent oxidoreductase [Clostridia bacterium]|nr:SDR family NAD(P)-dependent oxidoreductase [Clostridia bacterium]